MVPRRLMVAALVAVASVASACGGERDALAPPSASPPAESSPDRGVRAAAVPARSPAARRAPAAAAKPAVAAAVRRPAARARRGAAPPPCGPARLLRSTARAFAAVARGPTTAYTWPGTGRPVERFGALNANGVPTVFGVLASRRCGATWYRVQLPIRPNGSVGWIRADDVDVVGVRTSIEVDLSRRTLTLAEEGKPILTAPVAIGAPPTPTPPGSYYVNQRLVAPDPSGPYGPAAVGISGFSPTLTGWTQGGPLAIHGTNRPDLIGQAISHGCVRVRNDVLRQIYARAEPGTPVVIAA
jgi:lipoprotein-anchoring transpeptidase ErfK/SrfK